MKKILSNKKEQQTVFFILVGFLLTVVYLIMCHVLGRTPEVRLYRCIFKVFIDLCWMMAAFTGSYRMQGTMKKKTLQALVCYSVGDILAPANFLIGGIAFFIGHLIITDGYLRQYGMSRKQWGTAAVVSIVMFVILILSLGADWRIPFFALYLIVLMIMDVASFSCRYYFVTVNILLFSDLLAYFRKLFFNRNWLYDITLIVYYIAVLMYCCSFWFLGRENRKR